MSFRSAATHRVSQISTHPKKKSDTDQTGLYMAKATTTESDGFSRTHEKGDFDCKESNKEPERVG